MMDSDYFDCDNPSGYSDIDSGHGCTAGIWTSHSRELQNEYFIQMTKKVKERPG